MLTLVVPWKTTRKKKCKRLQKKKKQTKIFICFRTFIDVIYFRLALHIVRIRLRDFVQFLVALNIAQSHRDTRKPKFCDSLPCEQDKTKDILSYSDKRWIV